MSLPADRLRRSLAAAALLLVAAAALPPEAGAIPVFARRYNQSCNLCHAPAPRLTDTGARGRQHGLAVGQPGAATARLG